MSYTNKIWKKWAETRDSRTTGRTRRWVFMTCRPWKYFCKNESSKIRQCSQNGYDIKFWAFKMKFSAHKVQFSSLITVVNFRNNFHLKAMKCYNRPLFLIFMWHRLRCIIRLLWYLTLVRWKIWFGKTFRLREPWVVLRQHFISLWLLCLIYFHCYDTDNSVNDTSRTSHCCKASLGLVHPPPSQRRPWLAGCWRLRGRLRGLRGDKDAWGSALSIAATICLSKTHQTRPVISTSCT